MSYKDTGSWGRKHTANATVQTHNSMYNKRSIKTTAQRAKFLQKIPKARRNNKPMVYRDMNGHPAERKYNRREVEAEFGIVPSSSLTTLDADSLTIAFAIAVSRGRDFRTAEDLFIIKQTQTKEAAAWPPPAYPELVYISYAIKLRIFDGARSYICEVSRIVHDCQSCRIFLQMTRKEYYRSNMDRQLQRSFFTLTFGFCSYYLSKALQRHLFEGAACMGPSPRPRIILSR